MHIKLGTEYRNAAGRRLQPKRVGREGDRIVVVAVDLADGSRHVFAISTFEKMFGDVKPPCFFCDRRDGHRDGCPAVA